MPDANVPRIALLGVPIDMGASQRGTLMGPDALRTAGIRPCWRGSIFTVEDHGNLSIAGMPVADDAAAGKTPTTTARSRAGCGR